MLQESNYGGLCGGGVGGNSELIPARFTWEHTAFDQSLNPLSAVVKGCVLQIFGPNVEEDVWESLVKPGGWRGTGEVVPVVVDRVRTRQS